MKKEEQGANQRKPKKLTLSKESLRRLSSKELNQAAGGQYGTGFPGGGPCGTTLPMG